MTEPPKEAVVRMCADEEGQEMLAGSTSQLEGRWESADVGQGTGPEPGPGACIQERTCHTRVSKAAPSGTRLCSGTGALGAVPAPHSLWAPSCGGCLSCSPPPPGPGSIPTSTQLQHTDVQGTRRRRGGGSKSPHLCSQHDGRAGNAAPRLHRQVPPAW